MAGEEEETKRRKREKTTTTSTTTKNAYISGISSLLWAHSWLTSETSTYLLTDVGALVAGTRTQNPPDGMGAIVPWHQKKELTC